MLLLGERGSAVGGPAPISTPCSAEVCALSLPRWHPGHTQGAGMSLPSARPEAARTMTPAPPLLQPCQATTLHQSQGPAHPPQHPCTGTGRCCFPSSFPPLSLLDDLSQSQHRLAGISSGVAELPRARLALCQLVLFPAPRAAQKHFISTCLSSLLFLLPSEA